MRQGNRKCKSEIVVLIATRASNEGFQAPAIVSSPYLVQLSWRTNECYVARDEISCVREAPPSNVDLSLE